MLNTDDEDALSEELIEMAGVKEIYKKPKKEEKKKKVYRKKKKTKKNPRVWRGGLSLTS